MTDPTPHKTIPQTDPETGHETGQTAAVLAEVSREMAQAVIAAPTGNGDGRSHWYAVRFPNGDLMLACFPYGDTYERFSESIDI